MLLCNVAEILTLQKLEINKPKVDKHKIVYEDLKI